jgi:hypothetical protein
MRRNVVVVELKTTTTSSLLTAKDRSNGSTMARCVHTFCHSPAPAEQLKAGPPGLQAWQSNTPQPGGPGLGLSPECG